MPRKVDAEVSCKWKRESRTNEALAFNGLLYNLIARHSASIQFKHSKAAIHSEKMILPTTLKFPERGLSIQDLAQLGHSYLISIGLLKHSEFKRVNGRPLRCLTNAGLIKLHEDLGYEIELKKSKAVSLLPFIHILNIRMNGIIIDLMELCEYGKALINAASINIRKSHFNLSPKDIIQPLPEDFSNAMSFTSKDVTSVLYNYGTTTDTQVMSGEQEFYPIETTCPYTEVYQQEQFQFNQFEEVYDCNQLESFQLYDNNQIDMIYSMNNYEENPTSNQYEEICSFTQNPYNNSRI
ncbi:hypothetical protein QTN25_010339 [Entamoeba marina]